MKTLTKEEKFGEIMLDKSLCKLGIVFLMEGGRHAGQYV